MTLPLGRRRHEDKVRRCAGSEASKISLSLQIGYPAGLFEARRGASLVCRSRTGLQVRHPNVVSQKGNDESQHSADGVPGRQDLHGSGQQHCAGEQVTIALATLGAAVLAALVHFSGPNEAALAAIEN